MRSLFATAAAAAFLLAVSPADASNCVLGARVTDRSGKTGTVVKMDGANSCYVQIPGEAKPHYYLQWMLKPAGTARQTHEGNPTLATGHYRCSAAAGIAGTMRLDITGGSTYEGNGKGGSFRLDAASGKIQFTSGPWAGMFGARLGPGKIGVSSRPGGSYMTTCNLG